MKNAVLPRVLAAVVSVFITFALFDQVARLGHPAQTTVAASAPVHVAAADR